MFLRTVIHEKWVSHRSKPKMITDIENETDICEYGNCDFEDGTFYSNIHRNNNAYSFFFWRTILLKMLTPYI